MSAWVRDRVRRRRATSLARSTGTKAGKRVVGESVSRRKYVISLHLDAEHGPNAADELLSQNSSTAGGASSWARHAAYTRRRSKNLAVDVSDTSAWTSAGIPVTRRGATRPRARSRAAAPPPSCQMHRVPGQSSRGHRAAGSTAPSERGPVRRTPAQARSGARRRSGAPLGLRPRPGACAYRCAGSGLSRRGFKKVRAAETRVPRIRRAVGRAAAMNERKLLRVEILA